MSYLVWKLIHIASVNLFLGNITTGLFWAAHARRSRDFTQIAAALDGIIKSDRLFTIPGVIGILVSGIAAAMQARLPVLGTGWILWPAILFLISGLVFGVRVAPLQRKLFVLARDAGASADRQPEFDRAFRSWELWGLVALALPVGAMVIMVLKPALPAM